VKFSRLYRLPVGLLAAASTLFGLAGSAHASLLTRSGTNCSSGSESQVFLPWQDPFEYYLAPGGAFQPGDPSWATTGGAGVVSGGEPWNVSGSASGASMSLPAGSSATSATFCVGVNQPSVRLFAQNTGSQSSSLAVDVNFVGTLGIPLTAQIGSISGDSTWQVTPIMPILVNLLTLLPGNQTPVSLTFVPQGSGGNWQIDDLYVDPFGRG
jgi:hypothetical protein